MSGYGMPGKRNINPDKYNYQLNAAKKVWRDNHYMEKGLPFELFLKLSKMPCAYCGDIQTILVNRAQKDRDKGLAVSDVAIENSNFAYNGIDKTDPTLGYIESNIVTACFKCNLMKHLLQKQAFLNQIEKIYNYQHRTFPNE